MYQTEMVNVLFLLGKIYASHIECQMEDEKKPLERANYCLFLFSSCVMKRKMYNILQ